MKYLLLFSAFAVLTTGCRKNLDDVDDVHFDVSLEAETFKVGEPVRFHFSGNPDFTSSSTRARRATTTPTRIPPGSRTAR